MTSPKRLRAHLGCVALSLAATSAAFAEDPQQWLAKMNLALAGKNYDGVVTHAQGGKVETLRIIHRVQDGVTMERLVSLDGSGREFIRTGQELACYLPDEHTVLVEQQPEESLILGNLPTFDAMTSQYYDVKAVKRMRFLGRKVQLISVEPKDDFRYGYRLWIDERTALPLRTQLCDGHGSVIEQITFASLETKAHIADAAFKPDIATDGFHWLRQQAAPVMVRSGPPVWNVATLPPGFRMTVRAAQVMPGGHEPVAHIVVTDGVASVSVFVESRTQQSVAGVIAGSAAQVGSSAAFSTVVDGHQVTAVGEVPPDTVRFIANAVRAQAQPPPH